MVCPPGIIQGPRECPQVSEQGEDFTGNHPATGRIRGPGVWHAMGLWHERVGRSLPVKVGVDCQYLFFWRGRVSASSCD
jgi:hypothetical protein